MPTSLTLAGETGQECRGLLLRVTGSGVTQEVCGVSGQGGR